MLKGLLVYIFFMSCALSADILRVAVAANVSYAMDELKAEFEKSNPDIKVQVTLGSSGKLTAQIRNKAPYHIFMSANMRYPVSLYKAKIAKSKPRIYAKGSLALFSIKKRDFSDYIEVLKSKDIRKIAIANPKTAPYGKAAFEVLRNLNILDLLKKKFVYGESVSQTFSYAMRATDIGFVAKSLLYSPKMAHFKQNQNWIELNSSLYTPISQGIVALVDVQKNSDVKKFYDFIFTHKAKKIFEKYGYITK